MDEILISFPITITIHDHALSHICKKQTCINNAEFATALGEPQTLVSVCGIHLKELIIWWIGQIVESKKYG